MKNIILFINTLLLLNSLPVFCQDSTVISKDTTYIKEYPKLIDVQKKYIDWVDKKGREFPFAVPAIAYNKYDGMQIGAALINLKQPVKNVDFSATLLYGIRSKKVNGTVNVDYYYKPKKGVVTEVKPGVKFQSFTYDGLLKSKNPKNLKYYALHPEIIVKFNHRSEKLQKYEHQLSFRNHLIFKRDLNYIVSGGNLTTKDTVTRFYVNEFSYLFKRNDKNFPVNVSINFEQTSQFLKTYIEANSFIRYQLKDYKTGVHLRWFVGGFLWRKNQFLFNNDYSYAQYGFSSNGRTGSQDYFFKDLYVARNESDGFGAKQITKTDGYLKVVTPLSPIGQTPNWMLAFNLKLDFPIKYVPIKFFFDLAYSYNNKYGNGAPLPIKSLQYDAGLMLSFFDEGFEIYFPFLMSKDYKDYYKANAPKFRQRITFLLDLNKLELHKKIRDMNFKFNKKKRRI